MFPPPFCLHLQTLPPSTKVGCRVTARSRDESIVSMSGSLEAQTAQTCETWISTSHCRPSWMVADRVRQYPSTASYEIFPSVPLSAGHSLRVIPAPNVQESRRSHWLHRLRSAVTNLRSPPRPAGGKRTAAMTAAPNGIASSVWDKQILARLHLVGSNLRRLK
jgi:hypothetical protein